MPIISKNLHAKSKISTTKTKELLRFHIGCHAIKFGLVSNRNVVSMARDLVPTSKKLYFSQTIKKVAAKLE